MQGSQHCGQGPDFFNKPITLKKNNIKNCLLDLYCRKDSSCLSASVEGVHAVNAELALRKV